MSIMHDPIVINPIQKFSASDLLKRCKFDMDYIIKTPLFHIIQMLRIFQDSKTFPDMETKKGKSPEEIMTDFQQEFDINETQLILQELSNNPTKYEQTKKTHKEYIDKLILFVEKNFDVPSYIKNIYFENYAARNRLNDCDISIRDYMDILTNHILKRKPDATTSSICENKKDGSIVMHGSSIPQFYPYIVPGGRFGEMYYWDTFFTSLALIVQDDYITIKNMIDNFIVMIEAYGFVPNGTRSYYLSRSQPPFLALMIDMLVTSGHITNEELKNKYIPALEKELTYWLSGEKKISIKEKTASGKELYASRYCDKHDIPRPEAWLEDIITAYNAYKKLAVDPKKIHKDLRSAAETGWDFSSRWLENKIDLETIHTTDIIPADLQALLYKNARIIADFFRKINQPEKAGEYEEIACNYKKFLCEYSYSPDDNMFHDYDHSRKMKINMPSIAGIFPIFAGATASITQAKISINALMKERFFTTICNATGVRSGQQWDYPNAWPPHQWIAVMTLLKYGYYGKAISIIYTWINIVNYDFYLKPTNGHAGSHVLKEKYDSKNPELNACGGEYQVQEGFGWTIGVEKAFLHIGQILAFCLFVHGYYKQNEEQCTIAIGLAKEIKKADPSAQIAIELCEKDKLNELDLKALKPNVENMFHRMHFMLGKDVSMSTLNDIFNITESSVPRSPSLSKSSFFSKTRSDIEPSKQIQSLQIATINRLA